MLGLVTAGTVSLVMGAALMNYMGFYVGDLLHRCAGAPEHGLAMLIAWNPWSIVRVIAFVILAAVVYFFVVVPYTRVKERYFPSAPPGTPEDIQLLREIRDLMQAEKQG